MMRPRPLILLVLAALLAAVFAACGDEGGEASSSTDVNELLEETFKGGKKVDSGKLDLAVKIEGEGKGAADLKGPVTMKVAGPFETQGAGKLPKFKLDLEFAGGGQNLEAGATSTGEKGFVNFQGTDYVVSDQVFEQFKAGYEQAQKQSGGQQGQSFASLGMDPRKWLKDARNEGEAKVGDADTIKITGGVDIPALLDDINTALGKARSLGLQNAGQLPTRLTDAQRRQIQEAVKEVAVEIYTGKDDKILRRLRVALQLDDKESKTSGKLGLDLSLTGVNDGQDIPEPSEAKPFDELASQLGALGLGLGGSSSPGSGGGSSSGGSANIEKYSECITEAGNDVDKARKCADLLTP